MSQPVRNSAIVNPLLYSYRTSVWIQSAWTRLSLRGAVKRVAEPPSKPKRVLVVLVGLLGDSVMSLPAMSAIRDLWPDVFVGALVHSQNAELLGMTRTVDCVYVTEGSPFPLRRARRRALRNLQAEISEAGFDLAIVLLGDHFIPMVARSGVRAIIGDKQSAWKSVLTRTFDGGDARLWGPRDRLNAIRCLGYNVTTGVPRLCVDEEARDSVRQFVSELGLDPGRPLILLHPWAASPNRCLSPEHVRRLSGRVADHTGAEILIIGGRPSASASVRAGSAALPPGPYRNLTGRLSLRQTCALMERADLVITTDSGPLHLAGALARPTVGLFRRVRMEYAELYPTVAPVAVESVPAECGARCSWDSWYGCSQTPCRQISGIPDEIVTRRAAELVRSGVGADGSDRAGSGCRHLADSIE